VPYPLGSLHSSGCTAEHTLKRWRLLPAAILYRSFGCFAMEIGLSGVLFRDGGRLLSLWLNAWWCVIARENVPHQIWLFWRVVQALTRKGVLVQAREVMKRQLPGGWQEEILPLASMILHPARRANLKTNTRMDGMLANMHIKAADDRIAIDRDKWLCSFSTPEATPFKFKRNKLTTIVA